MSLSDGLIDAWYFNNNEDNSVVGRSGFTSSFTASFVAGKMIRLHLLMELDIKHYLLVKTHLILVLVRQLLDGFILVL